MDEICEDYKLYWETNRFFQTEELESWGFDEPTLSGYYDSSSVSPPDGGRSTSPASNSKNIVSERNRRKKLNERLFTLRAAVPTISKMDKASIVKDAINYIQSLQAEERKIQSEITELELRKLSKLSSTSHSTMDDQQGGLLFPPSTLSSSPNKKRKTMMSCSDIQCRSYCSRGSYCGSPPRIEDVQLRFSIVGDNTIVVNLTCNKVAGAMVKLCELFESFKYKIVTTHINAFAGKLFKTVVVQVNNDEMELLKIGLETAIANLNNPQSHMRF